MIDNYPLPDKDEPMTEYVPIHLLDELDDGEVW